MIVLSCETVEKIIFYDKVLQHEFPEFVEYFQQWNFGMRSGLKEIAKDALTKFLDNLTHEHLDKLSNYFKTNVTVKKINSNIVRNVAKLSLLELENYLNKMNEFSKNFSLYRDANHVYICFWR